MITTGYSEAIADRIASEHAMLAARWFPGFRSAAGRADEVFPSDSLLDHIPSLIVDISAYLRAPEDEAIAANTLVVEKARELGHCATSSGRRCTRCCVSIRCSAASCCALSRMNPSASNFTAGARRMRGGRLAPPPCGRRADAGDRPDVRRPLYRRRSPSNPNGCASSRAWRLTSGASRWHRLRPPCRCCGGRS